MKNSLIKGNDSNSAILHDATSLVWGIDLINGKKITPHRVFDLALIVESIVLHEKLLFLPPPKGQATDVFSECISMLPNEISQIVDLEPGYRLDHMIRDMGTIYPGIGKDIWMTFPFPIDLICDPAQVGYAKKRPNKINDIESYTAFYLHEGEIRRGEDWDKDDQIDFDPLDRAAVDDTPSPYDLYDDHEDEQKLKPGTEASFYADTLLTRMRYYMLVSNILNLNYKPDSLRTPFFREMAHQSRSVSISMGEKILRHLEKKDQDLRKTIADFIDLPEITYRIPIILSTILNRVDTPKQIVEEAILLRNTKAARRYRSLMIEMSEDLCESRIDKIQKRLTEMEKIFGNEFKLNSSIDLISTADMKYSFLEDKLSEGINFSKIAGVGLSSLVTFFKKRKYLLLKNLSKEAKQIKDLNLLLEKVFGDNFSNEENKLLSLLQESKY